MEIQSGNGEEAASAVSATSGCVSWSPCGSQVEASDDPVIREDLQAAKRIERFDIPLDSLKRMFEKPAGANTVSPTHCTFLFHFPEWLFFLQVGLLLHNCIALHFVHFVLDVPKRWMSLMQLNKLQKTFKDTWKCKVSLGDGSERGHLSGSVAPVSKWNCTLWGFHFRKLQFPPCRDEISWPKLPLSYLPLVYF